MKLGFVGLFFLLVGFFIGWTLSRTRTGRPSGAVFAIVPEIPCADAFEIKEKDGLLFDKDGKTKFNGIMLTVAGFDKSYAFVREGKIDGWEIDVDKNNKFRGLSTWSEGRPSGITIHFSTDERLEFLKVESIDSPTMDVPFQPVFSNGKEGGIKFEDANGKSIFVPLRRRDVIEPYVPMWQK